MLNKQIDYIVGLLQINLIKGLYFALIQGYVILAKINFFHVKLKIYGKIKTS